MPVLEWTSQADFETGAITGDVSTTESPGDLTLDGPSGTWTSEVVEAPAWVHWSALRIPLYRPEGSSAVARVRTAATEVDVASATWSPYVGALSDEDEIRIHVGAMLANVPLAQGAWYQVQLTLLKG